MILNQADRDVAVCLLLSKMSEVYTFIMEKEELAKIQSMLAIYAKLARQTLVCADFISHYAKTKSACESIPLLYSPNSRLPVHIGIRLGKHVLGEMDTMTQNYNSVLDSLMQQFRDWAACGTLVIVHHMGMISGLFELHLTFHKPWHS
jgi:hypothetical protein